MPSRRPLRFNTIDEMLAGARALLAAEQAGKLVRCGDWSLGKAFGHLASWANMPFEGYPPGTRPPLPIRLVLRIVRGRILKKGMPTGIKVGRLPGGTLGLDEMSSDIGYAKLDAAFRRLQSNDPKIQNPAFGPLTHAQWIQLNLCHAELHLSFHNLTP